MGALWGSDIAQRTMLILGTAGWQVPSNVRDQFPDTGSQLARYAAVGWACAHQHAIVLHVLHAGFLLATVACTIPAFVIWRNGPSQRSSAADGEALLRRHFLATLAAGSGSLSSLIVAAMWIPTWIIPVCAR
jgi:hypothetical protein